MDRTLVGYKIWVDEERGREDLQDDNNRSSGSGQELPPQPVHQKRIPGRVHGHSRGLVLLQGDHDRRDLQREDADLGYCRDGVFPVHNQDLLS